MAIITQEGLFDWRDIEDLGDLERLQIILDNLPDEELMQHLEARRKKGRNDYPIRPMWNSLICTIIFEHQSIESLRRELARNGQLRQLCGFDPLLGSRAVPTPSAYSRFLNLLRQNGAKKRISDIFQSLVQQCYKELPDFGRELGIDGKAIASYAQKQGEKKNDLRGEHDANWGKHEHYYKKANGELVKTVKKWFGFTLHLIADTNYELPVAFTVTPASRNEKPVVRKLIRSIGHHKPEVLEICEAFTGDKGYDDTKLIKLLWEKHRIKPVIDIRNMWRDGEDTNLVPGSQNVVYNYKGTVSCVCMETGRQREMGFGGFEDARNSLKYRCPAMHYGLECKSRGECPVKSSIRINLSTDTRVFTPCARSSYAWKKYYNKRTAIERINSRIDRSLGFERHTIRGNTKMTNQITIGFSIMLALALGRFRQERPELMSSLVKCG